MQLLAIDPSITCSGWALFEIQSEQLLGVGKIKPPPPKFPLATRLFELNREINQLLETLKLGDKDYLIAEAPTTMRDPSAAIKVEQVRCAFEDLARQSQICVPGRINPRSVHYEILGLTGKQIPRKEVKMLANGTVEKLYKNQLEKLGFECIEKNLKRNQDIVDAILVGHLGITRIKSAMNADTKVEEYFQSLQKPHRSRKRA